MNLKKVLSNNAFWIINKELANEIGLNATVLLQHFVDLQDAFFEEGGFYQQQGRIIEHLPLTLDYLRKATKVLIAKDFIEVSKRGIPAKNHYTLKEDNILSFLRDTASSIPGTPLEVSQKHHKQEELNNKKNKEKDILDDEDFYGKIWFKIVDNYPANRIGNRQHGLKKFKKLSKEDAKLSAINLKRYLATVNETKFTKSLQNYIEHECYTEKYLAAEETKNDKTINTKTFNKDYEDTID